MGSIAESRKSPGERNENPLQYSCLENPTDRGVWQATMCGVTRVGHHLVTKLLLRSVPEKTMATTPVLLPGKSHGWRSLVGCSPWGGEKLDRTERLHFHFSLSCIGEGNGNPLHCSCLENPRDWGAWWAAIYGVAQSQTRLKRLSSSSSSNSSSSVQSLSLTLMHYW